MSVNRIVQSRKGESVICPRRRKAAHHCLGPWTAANGEWRNGSNNERWRRRKNTEWLIDFAGTAKQPAQAISHSVFSRLFNSDNAVSGSAGLDPNAADGIAQYLRCLACDCQSRAVALIAV